VATCRHKEARSAGLAARVHVSSLLGACFSCRLISGGVAFLQRERSTRSRQEAEMSLQAAKVRVLSDVSHLTPQNRGIPTACFCISRAHSVCDAHATQQSFKT
jgi:hypothetical protein